MGLFKVLEDLVELPIRVGVDVIKIPKKIVDGDVDMLENTSRGVEKIEEDLG